MSPSPIDPALATKIVHERYPGLSTAPDELAAAAAERELSASSAHLADLALALALARGDEAALRIFEKQTVPVLRAALARFASDRDFSDECIQRVRVKLLTEDDSDSARIVEYRALGALEAWIQIIAIREAQMMLRRQKKLVSDEDVLMRLADTDPVLRETRQELKVKLAEALHAAMAELEGRERTLLRMCLLEGATTAEVGKIYSVHRATAFRWLREAREHLLEGTRRHFQAAAGIRDSEVDSLMRSLAPSLSISW